MVLVSSLLCRPIFNLTRHTLAPFPCRRGRILRRSRLLSIPFLSLSFREIRHSEVLLNVKGMFTSGMFARSLVQISDVGRRSINILLVNLTRRQICVGALTTSQEARCRGITIINRLVLSLFSQCIGNC